MVILKFEQNDCGMSRVFVDGEKYILFVNNDFSMSCDNVVSNVKYEVCEGLVKSAVQGKSMSDWFIGKPIRIDMNGSNDIWLIMRSDFILGANVAVANYMREFVRIQGNGEFVIRGDGNYRLIDVTDHVMIPKKNFIGYNQSGLKHSIGRDYITLFGQGKALVRV